MTPIRIIRFKSPDQDRLLREIAEKLKQFVSGLAGTLDPKATRPILPYFDGLERCVGCGRFHTYLCPWCRELEGLTRIKVGKLFSTIEQRFAARRFAD